MSAVHLWGAVSLLCIFLLLPTEEFLCSGWKRRRRDIVDGFSETAIQSYFCAFHPSETGGKPDEWRKKFDQYYSAQYGRRRFLLPFLLMAGIAGLLFCWIGLSLPSLIETGSIGAGQFPILATLAVLGACMWILGDEITRWYCGNLSPADIYWWCFR